VLTLVAAERDAAYAAAAQVHFEGKHFRSDIGAEVPRAVVAAR
jgi:phosphoribosylamine-glycine ligase